MTLNSQRGQFWVNCLESPSRKRQASHSHLTSRSFFIYMCSEKMRLYFNAAKRIMNQTRDPETLLPHSTSNLFLFFLFDIDFRLTPYSQPELNKSQQKISFKNLLKIIKCLPRLLRLCENVKTVKYSH